jgi:hypothetical protein
MSEEELEQLKLLPDKVKIFRGANKKEGNTIPYGISWSLSKEVAKKFSVLNQATDETSIHELTINKESIVALFMSRGEREVIYLEDELQITK